MLSLLSELYFGEIDMIQNGTKPIAPHVKQLSFPRSFGTISATKLPDSFDTDAGLVVPDQNAEGYPFGCTGFTVVEIANDEDLQIYDPGYNYDWTREMEGHAGEAVGADLKTAFKSGTVYGVRKKNGEGNPLDNRRAPYYEVHPADGLDYFDSIRSAMIRAYELDKEKHSTGNGSYWLPEWANVPNGNIQAVNYDGTPSHYSWHAWNFKGWSIRDGVLRLKAKTHQGKNYGDGGFTYYTRDQVNNIFDDWGTMVLMQVKAEPQDMKRVQLTLIETALYYLTRMIKWGGYKEAFPLLVSLLKLIGK